MNPSGFSRDSVRSRIDWKTILVYVLLLCIGWVSIYSAGWDPTQSEGFSFGASYGRQLIWIALSGFTALVITLSSSKYWHMFSYPFYGLMLAIVFVVPFFAREVNGANSWLDLGAGVRVQPSEFLKIATALALARFMSSYSFDIRSSNSLFYVGLIVFVPILLVLLQNDTGSALVFGAFFIMLYREGLGKVLYIVGGVMIALFLFSFILEPLLILLILFFGIFMVYMFRGGNPRILVGYWGLTLGLTLTLMLVDFYFGWDFSNYSLSLIAISLSSLYLVHYTALSKDYRIIKYLILFGAAVVFTQFIDFAFENILQQHQQNRILDMLGIVSDPKNLSYNVIQSKIAIGSGGFWGKGFLEGTQNKFSFIPEESTDFIFCTVGEEHGFIGSLIVVVLYGLLIYRVMRMGERQVEPFARVYCYCVAGIFFMHFFINIAMTIGLFPVVGIPLPFLSYGGSSLIAFTVLLFIAIRLDSVQVEN